MAQIKIRIELNKGRTGAPMDKLGDVSRQLERFLRAVADDLEIESKKGEWLAVNFANGSVNWDAALQTEVSESAFRRFNDSIEFLADYDPDTEGSNGLVSDVTLLEFGKIGTHLDPDEVILLGVYSSSKSKKPKKWRQISYRTTHRAKQAVETPIASHGSVQGIMHSLVKEGTAPHFTIRELATDLLVRCYYSPSMYEVVVDCLRDRTATVFVSGAIKYDRIKRQPDEVRVEHLERCKSLSREELHSFFGAAPNLTGDLSTTDFMERVRGDG